MTAEETTRKIHEAISRKDKDLFCRTLNLPPYCQHPLSSEIEKPLHYLANGAAGRWTDERAENMAMLAIEALGYNVDEENSGGRTPLVAAIFAKQP